MLFKDFIRFNEEPLWFIYKGWIDAPDLQNKDGQCVYTFEEFCYIAYELTIP